MTDIIHKTACIFGDLDSSRVELLSEHYFKVQVLKVSFVYSRQM
jgi:hypothetical protein